MLNQSGVYNQLSIRFRPIELRPLAHATMAAAVHTAASPHPGQFALGGGEVRMAGTPAELAASPDFVETFLGGGRGHAAAPSGEA
jgi:hypothetical protein